MNGIRGVITSIDIVSADRYDRMDFEESNDEKPQSLVPNQKSSLIGERIMREMRLRSKDYHEKGEEKRLLQLSEISRITANITHPTISRTTRPSLFSSMRQQIELHFSKRTINLLQDCLSNPEKTGI